MAPNGGDPADEDTEILALDEYVVPKLFLIMLGEARRLPSPGSNGGPVFHFPASPRFPKFQKAWVQGVVVRASDDRSRLLLDDGTGPPVEVLVPPTCVTHAHRSTDRREVNALDTTRPGSYVACAGTLVPATGSGWSRATRALEAERLRDLSDEPAREAMWNVEVIEAFKVLELASAHAAAARSSQ